MLPISMARREAKVEHWPVNSYIAVYWHGWMQKSVELHDHDFIHGQVWSLPVISCSDIIQIKAMLIHNSGTALDHAWACSSANFVDCILVSFWDIIPTARQALQPSQ